MFLRYHSLWKEADSFIREEIVSAAVIQQILSAYLVDNVVTMFDKVQIPDKEGKRLRTPPHTHIRGVGRWERWGRERERDKISLHTEEEQSQEAKLMADVAINGCFCT